MHSPIIKWLAFGLFLVAVFYLTQVGLGFLERWAVDTTPSLKTSQTAPETVTEQYIIGDGIPKCETEGYKIFIGDCKR